MFVILIVSQLASMVVTAGGAGCLAGDSQPCTLVGCAMASQACLRGAWGACRCSVQTCNSTPCVSAAIEFDPDLGVALCVPTDRPEGTPCGNGATCNGTDHCSAGACVAGDPLAVTASATCSTGSATTTVPVAQARGMVYGSPAAAPSPLQYAIPTMPAAGAPTVIGSKGSLSYDYSFQVPKARGRYQPDLRLHYTSESVRNTGFGVGWSLSGSFIEAIPTAPQNTNIWGVSSSFPIVKWELQIGSNRRRLLPLSTNGSAYQTEIQGEFASIAVAADGTWTATDLVGSIYSFKTHVSRTGLSGTGRYYLSKVVDVDGNATEYAYQGDRLDKLRYNNMPAGAGTGYATEVRLAYTDLYPARIERVTDAVVRKTQTLTRVTIARQQSDGTFAELLWHDLGFLRIQQNAGLVLSDITVRAGSTTEPVSLPPVKFAYGDAGGQYQLADGIDVPGLPATNSWQWQDLDGDGIADLLDYGGGAFSFQWQRGHGLNPAGVPVFYAPVQFSLASQVSSTVMLWDNNGDGVLDLLSWNAPGSANGQEIKVQHGAVGPPPSFGCGSFMTTLRQR